MQPCQLFSNAAGGGSGGVTKRDVCGSMGLVERDTQLIVVNIFTVRRSSYVHHRNHESVVQTCVACPFQCWGFVSSAGVQTDIVLAFDYLRAYSLSFQFHPVVST